MDDADPKPGQADVWRPPHETVPDTTFRSRVPVDQLTSRLTPSRDVFVLAHFGIPRIDSSRWRLHFSGMLDAGRTMKLGDIKAFPRYEIESFIKCAGFPTDHRIATRNASNALWAGARLVDVMESVGLSPQATYLWFTAPDKGSYQEWSADRYTKDLPITRVNVGDVLIAYEMNGEPLTPEHGFPVRVFVPGFYGTNSVKWLCHIEAADRRSPGIFTNELYNDPIFDIGGVATGRTVPVWGVAPEALIVEPRSGARLPAGRIAVSGWCWGEHPIRCVELSSDGGKSWITTIPDERHQTSWQAFSFEIDVDRPGKFTLQVRAMDSKGATQPSSDARNSIHEINVAIA